MPTGYTASIKRGTTLNEFAWTCARAFGALVMQRDDPSDAPIVMAHKPSDHHVAELEKAKAEKARLLALKGETLEAEVQSSFETELAAQMKREEERRARRDEYEQVLYQVKEWKAPTPDHEGLKKFMREQIEQSIEFDCGGSHDKRPTRPTDEEWKAKRLSDVEWRINYHTAEQRKEEERCADRTEWLQQLAKSVGDPPRKVV